MEFILAGSTHTTYCSGYEDCECTCVSIHNWKDVPCCKAMLDDLCEVEMKEMKEKSDGDLCSWKRVVTTRLMARGKPEAGTVRMPHESLTHVFIVWPNYHVYTHHRFM